MAKSGKITISDVAKIAGVSKQTVSRVINNKPDVAEHTRQEIRKVIQKLGYQPDPIAQSMKGITHTLGCILPDLTDHAAARLVQSAQITAREHQFSVWIEDVSTQNDIQAIANALINKRVDGILVINPTENMGLKQLPFQLRSAVPIVQLDNLPHTGQFTTVSIDYASGAYQTVRYLLTLGHKNILMISDDRFVESAHQKQAGFFQAIQDAHIDHPHNLVFEGDGSLLSGFEAVQDALQQERAFSAIFAQRDLMAIGAIQALSLNGLKVPEDVSVIGFDDHPWLEEFIPPLTSVHLPLEDCGRTSVELLIDTILNPAKSTEMVTIKPELIIRETTLPHNSNL